ncbi:MAG: methionine--tRNA ligase [Parcubacteria group bacterium]|nr:methionine--tRNA ligase [Parcubacteria group bacterium]
MISFEQFKEIKLKVGEVVAAEPIEGSSKLLKLKVSLGDPSTDSGQGIRQIIAGIGKKYAPEQLIGRQIVIAANLEPKQMMGEESQGMLLAADSPEGPVFLIPEQPVPPGTNIR